MTHQPGATLHSKHMAQYVFGPAPCKDCGISIGYKRQWDGTLWAINARNGMPHQCRHRTKQLGMFP